MNDPGQPRRRWKRRRRSVRGGHPRVPKTPHPDDWEHYLREVEPLYESSYRRSCSFERLAKTESIFRASRDVACCNLHGEPVRADHGAWEDAVGSSRTRATTWKLLASLPTRGQLLLFLDAQLKALVRGSSVRAKAHVETARLWLLTVGSSGEFLSVEELARRRRTTPRQVRRELREVAARLEALATRSPHPLFAILTQVRDSHASDLFSAVERLLRNLKA